MSSERRSSEDGSPDGVADDCGAGALAGADVFCAPPAPAPMIFQQLRFT